jgi:starvation-inducible DNA-binding protein
MKSEGHKTRGMSRKEGNIVRINSDKDRSGSATPAMGQRSPEIQKFGTRIPLSIGLDDNVCKNSIKALNQVVADTMTIRDLYKKHHWQVAGPTFYQLHLLYDKHYEEQNALVDLLAERIQVLGGISLAMSADVAEATRIELPPMGREEVSVQISRLAEAHELILIESRKAARMADESGDDGTNDLLISNIIRTNELQVWFLSEHLAPESLY